MPIKLSGRVTPVGLTGKLNMIPSSTQGGPLQSKIVSPRHEPIVVTPDEDYYGLVAVNIRAVPRIPACAVEVSEKIPDGVDIEIPVMYTVEIESSNYRRWWWNCVETTGGTSLTGEIAAYVGEWIFVSVVTRSETTIPEDWTILHRSHVLVNGLNQRLFLLCKQLTEAGTISLTISQTESARIYINLIRFSGIGGFRYHEGTEVVKDDDITFNGNVEVNCPEFSNRLWVCMSSLWSTASTWNSWTSNDGMGVICLGENTSDSDTEQPRLANFIKFNDTDASKIFTLGSMDSTESCYVIDCVEILL